MGLHVLKAGHEDEDTSNWELGCHHNRSILKKSNSNNPWILSN
jgi:hypothetical protein